MRYIKYIVCLMLILPLAVSAQNKKNLTKHLVGKITIANYLNRVQGVYIKHGEFRVYFDNKILTTSDNDTYTKNNKYFVIVRDTKDNILYARMNNYELLLSEMSGVNLLRAGYTIPDYVYVEKRDVMYAGKEENMYYLHLSNKVLGPFNKILDLFQDGFIYKLGKNYAYRMYNNDEHTINYTVPDEALYKEKTIRCNLKDTVLEFKPIDNVRYYTTVNGHYYLLYYDNYMENTLMVVDSTGYELDGALETVMFKYSQDGKHWIAAYPNNIIVDGVNVARLTNKIKNVAIKNNGQYAYVVEGKGMNDVMYIGENMIMKGVNVKWLAIDADDRFNYICRSKQGYFYGIDDDMCAKNEDLEKYYYPALFDSNDKFVVKSDDGKHVMEFSYDTPYIMIDNMRLDCPSIPHYAKWDESEHSFVWNAVEDYNLYLYKYKVKK